MTVTITFPQPAERLSLNDRRHWAPAAELKRTWKQAAFVAARRTIKPPRQQPPCYVRVTFPVNDNRRRDSDNPSATTKVIVDALVMAGCWPDDTPDWVETLGSRFDKGATVVVVELTPMDAVLPAEIAARWLK